MPEKCLKIKENRKRQLPAGKHAADAVPGGELFMKCSLFIRLFRLFLSVQPGLQIPLPKQFLQHR